MGDEGRKVPLHGPTGLPLHVYIYIYTRSHTHTLRIARFNLYVYVSGSLNAVRRPTASTSGEKFASKLGRSRL